MADSLLTEMDSEKEDKLRAERDHRKADCVDVKALMVDGLDDQRVVPRSDELLWKAYP